MFTGIVEQTGRIESFEQRESSARLRIACTMAGQVSPGQSVAVNGCCLTSTQENAGVLVFDLLHETLQRTNLGGMKQGSLVNLERALGASDRLGGHFVQGHIDCTARVIGLEPAGQDFRLEVELPEAFARYVIPKGSIAVDGISLTVAELKETSFIIWLIPHTMQITALHDRKAGDLVNLEFDMLAKYVERILARS